MRAEEMQQEAYRRAVTGQTATNYPAIFQGFTARGIPESEIIPRENVFTFHAWRKIGRTVMKGEKGVKVVTWIRKTKVDKKTGKEKTVTYPRTAYVFHVSQTKELKG